MEAKLDKIHYTAGKIVCGALHLTSKDKVNTELSWENIKSRADFLGITLFHKIATWGDLLKSIPCVSV